MAVLINKMMQKSSVSNSRLLNTIQISYVKHAAPFQVGFALGKLWGSGFEVSLKLSYWFICVSLGKSFQQLKKIMLKAKRLNPLIKNEQGKW